MGSVDLQLEKWEEFHDPPLAKFPSHEELELENGPRRAKNSFDNARIEDGSEDTQYNPTVTS